MRPPALVLAAAVALAACRAAPPRLPVVEPPPAPAAPAQGPSEAPLDSGWSCGGELVPPTGWQQDTAFVDATTPEARERAGQLATQKLERRLCGSDASSCEALRGRIVPWKTGTNGREICAMAVVKSADLQEWSALAQSLGKLDADLGKAAERLLGDGVPRGAKAWIDRVTDNGVPGGRRADWLRGRLEGRLHDRVKLTPPPRGWAGDGLPPGLDVAIRAVMFRRRENQIPIIEVHWSAVGRGAILGSADMSFPESAAPGAEAPSVVPLPEGSPGLHVHVDTHAGGSLCAGEHTQVWVKSDATAVVRAFTLYGAGEALLVYPDDPKQSGKLDAGASVPIGGPSGFDVVPVPGSTHERFLVITAPTEAGLGPFKAMKGTCRLPAGVARDLHQGKGLPAGVKSASDGYRLLSGHECQAEPTEERRQQMAAALAGLPECVMR